MRFFRHAALIAMLSTPALAFAQDSTPSEANDPLTLKMHEDVVVSGRYEPLENDRKVVDKKFWLVSTALNTTMLLDTWSTFDVMSRCPTCREANPYVAPFVKKGPAVTFTAGQAFDIGVMALAAKMKASKKPQIRNIWWVVPVALTTGHVIAFNHNRQLAR
jgi:hypothetical protein